MKPVANDVQFPALESAVAAFWKENGIIEKGLEANKGAEPFVFNDGPPFATGLPHYGHILPGTLKDVVPRYWVMKGRYVRRRWGWDCHGLPVEFELEKELGLNGKSDIEKFGIAKFNEACRGTVTRYTAEWERLINRAGRWADFKNAYRTMDRPFMDSVWWVVKSLFDKGLVYEGYRVMPYSWRVATPLSNFEAGLNYQEVQDPALTVRFREKGGARTFLAWTTTPWTLPSNLALSVGPTIRYAEVKIAATGEVVVLAKERLGAYFKDPSEYTQVAEHAGIDFDGRQYEPLFPFFADHAPGKAFRIVLGDHVTTTDGTGIVHTAPAFGEEDFNVCREYGIQLVDPVDAEGKFTSAVPPYAGMHVKDADKNIARDLKDKGALFRHDTLQHSYPFCWRSDTPLIYKAIATWFLKIDPFKDRLLANNRATRWVPSTIRDGRFGNWLEAARDWNISRNRYWGTPIPIWRSDDGELLCVGSAEELEKLSGRKLPDIHKHFVDDITFPSPKTGKTMRRIPEVLDCWFESGSMPYGQLHYPFENKDVFAKTFPADFIAEGMDQTRGWFYTQSVLSAALFEEKPTAPFKNVIVNGLVLAEDGKKMSKRLKNYPEVSEVFDKYGADALRAYLVTSPAARGDDLRFSESGVREVVRSVLLPYWNAYSFFVTYALADKWDRSKFRTEDVGKATELDRWIVSRFHSLVRTVDEKMEAYLLYEVVPAVLGFLEELTNWYVRLNRRRFWSDQWDADKAGAYATLYFVLTQFTRVLAPLLPFVTEEVFQNLEREKGSPESIHLAQWPAFEAARVDKELEETMAAVRNIVSLGRACRASAKIKTRQPLRTMSVYSPGGHAAQALERFRALIQSELNVEEVTLAATDAQFVDIGVKPDWKAIGADHGKATGRIAKEVGALTAEQWAPLVAGRSIQLADGTKVEPRHIAITRTPKAGGAVAHEEGTTVWLDTTLDEKLLLRGLTREFVSRIQRLRKQQGLAVTDRIKVRYEAGPELDKALAAHDAFVRAETLAVAVEPGTGAWLLEEDLDGLTLKLSLEKVV